MKKCVACGELIENGAKKCRYCHSFQTKQWLSASNSIISFLAMVISIAGAISAWVAQQHKDAKQANPQISSLSYISGAIAIDIYNSGSLPAYITAITVAGDSPGAWLESDGVSPGLAASIRFELDPPAYVPPRSDNTRVVATQLSHTQLYISGDEEHFLGEKYGKYIFSDKLIRVGTMLDIGKIPVNVGEAQCSSEIKFREPLFANGELRSLKTAMSCGIFSQLLMQNYAAVKNKSEKWKLDNLWVEVP